MYSDLQKLCRLRESFCELTRRERFIDLVTVRTPSQDPHCSQRMKESLRPAPNSQVKNSLVHSKDTTFVGDCTLGS